MCNPGKNILIIIGLSLLSVSACKRKAAEQISKQEKPIVLLQPLAFDDSATFAFLKDSIEQFYPVTVVVLPVKQFPDHIYYQPRSRYRADRIIHWLRLNMIDSARAIVGVTTKDISVTKGEIYDYGVMGLGYRPGHACVVSSFRLSKTARSKKHLEQRLFKLAVHEMGHNFGLPHCLNETCIMVDAEGQMKLDQEKELCISCKEKLSM